MEWLDWREDLRRHRGTTDTTLEAHGFDIPSITYELGYAWTSHVSPVTGRRVKDECKRAWYRVTMNPRTGNTSSTFVGFNGEVDWAKEKEAANAR